jgi:hypothetical protein
MNYIKYIGRRIGMVASLALSLSWATAQTNTGGSTEDAQIFNTGANQGRIVIDFDTAAVEDWIRIYYPPRNEANSTRIYDWNGSTWMLPNGVHHIDITFGPGQSQNVEIVVNEGGQSSYGTWWGYTGTITGQGQRPIVINGGQPITPMQPPSVVTGTGRIFNPTSTGGGGRSVAGTGHSSRRNPRASSQNPTARRGYVGRIVGSTTNVRLNKASSSKTAQPNPSGSMPKVLFSGRGNLTTLIRKTPSRSTRRIVLRGGRP